MNDESRAKVRDYRRSRHPRSDAADGAVLKYYGPSWSRGSRDVCLSSSALLDTTRTAWVFWRKTVAITKRGSWLFRESVMQRAELRMKHLGKGRTEGALRVRGRSLVA